MRLISIARLYLERTPPYLIYFITARCNSKCRTCFNWENIERYDPKQELSLKEIENISRNFGFLAQLTLSGGEPYLRPDLPEICSIFSKYNKPLVITIPTNALLPDEIEKKTKAILELCPSTYFRISLSLDGIGEGHDEIRGVNGSYQKFLGTYHRLVNLKGRYKNFSIDLTTVINFYNYEKIEYIFRYAEENFSIDNHLFALARGHTRDSKARDIHVDAYRKIMELFAQRKRRKEMRPFSILYRALFQTNMETIFSTLLNKKMVLPCVAGRKVVILTERGDVYPCELLETGFGNIRDYGYDIKRVLKTPVARGIINSIKKDRCYCTFECAMNISLLFHLRSYPRILKNVLSELSH